MYLDNMNVNKQIKMYQELEMWKKWIAKRESARNNS